MIALSGAGILIQSGDVDSDSAMVWARANRFPGR
jgi:hypothetical protein